MLFALKLKILLLVAGLAAPLAGSDFLFTSLQTGDHSAHPDLVRLPAGMLHYRPAGDFTQDGKPHVAPIAPVAMAQPFEIMRRQVTAAEYQECVDAGHCRKLAQAAPMRDRPVVGVSGRDADGYAKWLSERTGRTYRLPTDAEWAYAAGSRFRDDVVMSAGSDDPAVGWLAHYEKNAERETASKEPQPIGAFGANEFGLLDVAGNVWEWTESCFVRASLTPDGYRVNIVNCGVRVVEGAHRTYMTDFVRDARAGGCAAGAPPANLGFRLVREAQKPILHSVSHWLRPGTRDHLSK